jgi:beta-1,4-N-acetylglucosaminyltransferase
MIFVTIGTSEPFERLLGGLPLPPAGEELVVQMGESNTQPAGATCLTYMAFDELADYVRRARLVVTHAGVGTIMVAHQADKRCIVVPRLARFGEAIDDHQLLLARRLDALGIVTLVEDMRMLPEVLAAANGSLEPVDDWHPAGLASELGDFLASKLALPVLEPR